MNTAIHSPHRVVLLCSQEKPLNQLLLAVSFLWFTPSVAISARYSPTLAPPFFSSSWLYGCPTTVVLTALVLSTGIMYGSDMQNLQAWPVKHSRGGPPWSSHFLWLKYQLPEARRRLHAEDGRANAQAGSLKNWGEQSPWNTLIGLLGEKEEHSVVCEPLQFGSVCDSSLSTLINTFILLICLPQVRLLCNKSLWLTSHVVACSDLPFPPSIMPVPTSWVRSSGLYVALPASGHHLFVPSDTQRLEEILPFWPTFCISLYVYILH